MHDITPQHVVIIPDGNRRWAKENGKKPWEGHEIGARRVEEILTYARKENIRYVSVWGSSIANMKKRPLMERQALLRIYEEQIERLIQDQMIVEDEVCVHIIGRWREQFPKMLIKKINTLIDKTQKYDRFHITIFLAYSGDDEMVRAVQHIVDSGIEGDDVTGSVLKKNLMTRDLPPVDYLIRTGGEPHMSVGFMMWDIANAQLYFTDKHFPDFDTVAFKVALNEYELRARRHGA